MNSGDKGKAEGAVNSSAFALIISQAMIDIYQ